MIFNTWIFGFFLLGVFCIYWFVLKPEWRPLGLLSAGILFYTYYFPAYMLLIGLLSLFVHISGVIIRKYRGLKEVPFWKSPIAIMWVSVVTCVLVLGYYKYLKLLISSINDVYKAAGSSKSFASPEILVPLGLSFFIFEFIHYLIDSYHGRTKPSSILEFGVFALFFPTLVAGPIKRFQPFITQLREKRQFNPDYLTQGLSRILSGLGKKVLIADFASMYASPLTNYSINPGVSTASLWLAVYAYAIKIFFDFSGYSDIAIGCAKLFGYEVPENFNWPYLARNISEFWRKWHMSLSSWLREYLYMPVGKKLMPVVGKKSPFLLSAVCQMITMGVCGLWHGAYWNFLIWGLYHGAGLTVHKAFSDNWTRVVGDRAKADNTSINLRFLSSLSGFAGRLFSTLITFQFVCIGWVFFVLNINDSISVLKKLFMIS